MLYINIKYIQYLVKYELGREKNTNFKKRMGKR